MPTTNFYASALKTRRPLDTNPISLQTWPLKSLSRPQDIPAAIWIFQPFEPLFWQYLEAFHDIFNLSKDMLLSSSILVVCLAPLASGSNHATSRGEITIMLLLYTKEQISVARLTSAWDTEAPFLRQLRLNVRWIVFSILEPPAAPCLKNTPPTLCYRPFESIKSTFGFLKYAGPRLLRPGRKVILEEEGYQITHIGQGAFAVISRVLYRPTGDVRVMKRITFDNSGLAKYLAKNEIDTLKAMAGNIWFPPLLNDFEKGNQFVVTMPYYRRGDLAGYMEHKRHLGREAAKFYCAQLIVAIQSLHKMGIVHRDIKTDNIFLDEDGHLVLADFGLAENISSFDGGEPAMTSFPLWIEARARGGDDFPFLWVNRHNPLNMRGSAGTFWYTAPEVFRKERYSFGVDYWSVGVIYHELITGHIPFNHYKPYPENKCPELDFRRKPGQLKDINDCEQKALSQLLSPYPTDRPQTVTAIKNSPLFRDVDWIGMSQRKIRPPSLPPPLAEDGYPYPNAPPSQRVIS